MGAYCSCYNNIFNFISVFPPLQSGTKILTKHLYEYPTHLFKYDEPLNIVHSFDLVFCSETWQRKGEHFDLNGYDCIDVPRKESVRDKRCKRGHGGVCLFLKHNIAEEIQILDKK